MRGHETNNSPGVKKFVMFEAMLTIVSNQAQLHHVVVHTPLSSATQVAASNLITVIKQFDSQCSTGGQKGHQQAQCQQHAEIRELWMCENSCEWRSPSSAETLFFGDLHFVVGSQATPPLPKCSFGCISHSLQLTDANQTQSTIPCLFQPVSAL